MKTFAFNLTFTRPDEDNANVYKSGHNVNANTRDEAERELRERHAHLTVSKVELFAVMDEDGNIVNLRTVESFDLGLTYTGRFPYALAKLSCGHVAAVTMRPNRGACMKCGLEVDVPIGGATCACGSRGFTILKPYPNPHNEADRVEKVGDQVHCDTCDREDAQVEWLRSLDRSTVHHGRLRHGSYYFYRYDAASPSCFFLIGGVMVSPRIEAVLRELKLSPLSPTEQA